MEYQIIATATFGLEAVVRREIEKLGYEIERTEDGKVTFRGDERAIVRANLYLRSADRVLLKMGEFEVKDFETLFQETKALTWGDLIAEDGRFTVSGTSVKSKLQSVPANQKIVKKAIVEKLNEKYGEQRYKETGAAYDVKITLLKDRATITVDTSGVGLHKRGYRVKDVSAPIKETLAAALVQLSFWNKDRIMVDPCCGSGTLAIEAAMIGMNIPPGLNRTFACMDWELIPKELWREEKAQAYRQIDNNVKLEIYGYDIDAEAISASQENAETAGVEDSIVFQRKDIKDIKREGERGIVITNPPYGERIGENREIKRIYSSLNRFFKENKDWSLFMITTDKGAEMKAVGRKADRRRKLYNGRLETCYYQFYGVKNDSKNR